MKVILNKDLSSLGEEGDVRDVARGYARNFLFPRKIAVPYNDKTVQLFEARREEIEARKADKRKDAAGLKEKLESLTLEITMPAGANGKLYGAVTSQTVVDELTKQGYQIERKRVELPGTHFKSVGKYKASVKLYESAAAEIQITIIGQEIKTETRSSVTRPPRRRRDAEAPSGMPPPDAETPPSGAEPASGGAGDPPSADEQKAAESVPAEAAGTPDETASGNESVS
ncbi:MAG: 50S ribosomal protein L9 [Treponema sp.]|jgi:large subunit ribosomal protein L9|nr:50S ribosomal protein L9 [Treponema sp.]